MMKKLLLVLILFCSLPGNASNLAGGDIPIGDKLRIGAKVDVVDETDVTVLSDTSNGGTLHAICMSRGNSSSSSAQLLSIKATVDGASERTYNGFSTDFDVFYSSTAAGYGLSTFCMPLPIRWKSSITIKYNLNLAGGNGRLVPIWSEK